MAEVAKQRRLPNKIFVAPACCPRHSPTPQQRRQQRPGQLVPRTGTKRQKRPTAAEDAGDDEDQYQQQDRRPTPRPATRTWAERQERQEAAWAGQLPGIRQQMLSNAESHAQIKQQVSETLLGLVQTRVDTLATSWRLQHTCMAQPTTPSDIEKPFRDEPPAAVRYVGLLSSGTLAIPTVTCLACQQQYTPQAIDVGCFKSSPVDAHVWFDLSVHSSYHFLGVEGLSATVGLPE
ncbi:hypothetical protein PLESTM_000530500 [Pleodorina starrii]|nr:hypothetical protein PLESTM_000530500 [Pleodorina starrii]